MSFKGSPLYRIDSLLATGLPIILVYGDADEIVPFDENCAFLEKALEGYKNPNRSIRKSGIGHHPHSLEDPTEIVEFIIKNI